MSVRASGISFSYGVKQILSDVGLEVDAGTVMGLLGPNGAGKSTLLGVLSGDLTPDAGTVELGGRTLASFSRKELARARSVMPQSSEFPFAYLVRDIVAMGRASWDTGDVENDRVIDDAMARTAVMDMQDREITSLSGGESARVTLARVLAQDADIVFLDEPTAALDVSHQERTMSTCTELAAEGRTVVAVMHDIQLAAAYCDVIALMHRGRIVRVGAPSEVLTSESLSEIYEWPIRVLTLDDGELAILPARTGISSAS
ncbi:heme ABC transporter ATP-binding protein [Flaviflexus huanghaiensis]|uniref:heme ABC transporter ATP-binding protein n=1 Tax=Flaviflexus huanghaiensis TaxID=1111473 RepID=UPI0015F899DD